MDAKVVLKGESGGRLEFLDFRTDQDDCVVFWVDVHADWCAARVLVRCSRLKLENLADELAQTHREPDGKVVFLNEEGNFGIEVQTSVRGTVNLHVELSKSMQDIGRLICGFESDSHTLAQFSSALRNTLRSVCEV
jgi:hypothetical protein